MLSNWWIGEIFLFEGHTNVGKHFLKIYDDYQRFPKYQKFRKITKDFQRLPKTFDKDLNIFWWYTNNKLDISEIKNIFTCEDMENTPWMWMSPACGFVWILWVVYFPVKHLCLYDN